MPKAQAYDTAMYVLAALLVLGFLCNLLVRPVADKHFMSDAELLAEKRLRARARQRARRRGHAAAAAWSACGGGAAVATAPAVAAGGMVTVLAWAVVGIPLLIGIWITLQKAMVLFK